MRNDVISRHEVDIGKVDLDQVGPASDRQRTDFGAQPDRLRAAAGGHLQHRGCRQGFRVHCADFLQEGSQPHFLPHIEIVVARGAIGAQTDFDAGRQHIDHRRNAGRSLHIRRGVMNDADILFHQHRDIRLAGPDHMRAYRGAIEKSQRVEQLDRRHGVIFSGDIDLERRLLQVDTDCNAELFCRGPHLHETLGRDGIDGMGADNRNDAVVSAPPPLYEIDRLP